MHELYYMQNIMHCSKNQVFPKLFETFDIYLWKLCIFP